MLYGANIFLVSIGILFLSLERFSRFLFSITFTSIATSIDRLLFSAALLTYEYAPINLPFVWLAQIWRF